MRTRAVVVMLVVAASTLGAKGASAALPGENPACGNIDHSFRLTSNRFCGLDGWTITRDDITIDLGGFTLSSDREDDDATPFSEIGIQTGGSKNVTIRNGAVVGFETGILAISPNVTISKVVTSANLGSGMAVAGKNAVVRGSTSTGNQGHGIEFQGESLIGNVAANNRENGFSLGGIVGSVDEDGPLVARNHAAANGSRGFYLDEPNYTLENNHALGNRTSGIAVDAGGTDARIRGNTASGNVPHGIHLLDDDPSGIRISRNTVHANGRPDDGGAILGRGIEAIAGVGGGNNIAFGNDATIECVPVDLCVPAGSSTADLKEDSPPCLATITQSFKLSSDSALCGTDGWTIGKDNITIDLNGFALRGDEVNVDETEVGIDIDGHSGFTLRNGSVEGFDHGVSTGAGTIPDVVVSNVVFTDHNATGVIVSTRGEGRLQRVTSVANKGFGFLVNAPMVAGNVAVDNELAGIVISASGAKSTVTGNAAVLNGDGFTFGRDRSTARANRAFGNLNAGILARSDGLYERNTSSGNLSGDGIRVEADAHLTGNRAHGNGWLDDDGVGGGIVIDGSNDPTGSGNTALGNDAANCEGGLCS